MKFKNLSTGSVLTPGSELTVTQMLNHPEQYAPIEDAPAQNASGDASAQNASEDASAQEKKAKDARK